VSALKLASSKTVNQKPDVYSEIRSLVTELREARESLLDGQQVLTIVNEIAIVCEELFDRNVLDETSSPLVDLNQEFLSHLAVYAEDLRASNGEISDGFLDFLESVMFRGLRIAA